MIDTCKVEIKLITALYIFNVMRYVIGGATCTTVAQSMAPIPNHEITS